MNLKTLIGVFAMLLVCATSCKKDYLDKTPNDDLTIDEVFQSRQYAERFLTSAYNNLPEEINFHDWQGRNAYVGASDEMELTWTYPFAQLMTAGAWSADVIEQNVWRFNWEGIRKTSIFLENIDKTPFDDESQRNAFKGEAIFLRAFFHFLLLRAHGPIPVISHSFQSEDDFAIKRGTLEEGANFIVAECDRAAGLLPMTVTSDKLGRATKAAALALKARLLLYMASPLFNGNPDYVNFTDKDGRKLFPSFNDQKWQIAADAAKDCIDEVEQAGYGLYKSPSNDPLRNYQELFIQRHNKEVLFARNMGTYNKLELAASPNGMGGWSGLCPTQEQVDAYEMADGTAPITGYNTDGTPIINGVSGYQEAGYATSAGTYSPAGVRNMYVGREPRFYASINYNGAIWRGRGLQFWNSGLDGKGKGGQDFTVTGYLMKKMVDENVNLVQGGSTLKTWIYFRVGEQYLNYAEALNEAQGPVPDVYKYVNLIRERSGMPGLPTGLIKDTMRERIRHERRVELSFETHRYFDTRRWKIAEQTDNKNFYSMSIGLGSSLQDNAFYVRTLYKKRVFDKTKHYLWPIPQLEINKVPSLTQNPGW